jgi:hypothetical protein
MLGGVEGFIGALEESLDYIATRQGTHANANSEPDGVIERYPGLPLAPYVAANGH